jgi:hypothetical protein
MINVEKAMSDYKIEDYYSRYNPQLKQYMVKSGGCNISLFKTYEDAVQLVVNLAKDPWYLDRLFYTVKRNHEPQE